ncbi:MAG: hypothetical protein J2P13_06160, partial [Acidobacteria bacterium]|nr:hypothetical protein [Acidobacteriota bacterium]
MFILGNHRNKKPIAIWTGDGLFCPVLPKLSGQQLSCASPRTHATTRTTPTADWAESFHKHSDDTKSSYDSLTSLPGLKA